MKKLISFVIPVFNEELNIIPLYKEVILIIDSLNEQYDFEFVFTDNHSTDTTFSILKKLAKDDCRVKVFRFSKNFGYQKSILTGYLKAKGDALIQLDCDLQDPPSLIPIFIKNWENGNKVVYGVRKKRKEGVLINNARKLFYRIVNALSEDELPVDVGDFRLVDRCVVNELAQINDQQPYLRGAIAAIGFKQAGIEYERSERLRGGSKFNLSSLLNLALDGILNHSIIPLRIASFFGLFVTVITIISIFGYSFVKIFKGGDWPSGFTTTIVVILSGIAVNALFLGVIGEYIGRIYQQVKQRPITIIESSIDDLDRTKDLE